jgi:RNA polymerase sigma-70 factor (family 1)
MEAKEFRQKVIPLSQKLYRFAAGLLNDSHEAEDVVQDIFIKLWNMRNRIPEIQNLDAFTFRITRNLCLDKLKARRVRFFDDPLEAGVPEPVINAPNPEEEAELKDTVSKIHMIINTLPEQQKSILHLRDIQEYSYEEISEMMGMEVNAVRVTLSRARKTVRETLSKIHQPWKT